MGGYSSVVVGDFNRDGKLDSAVANENDNTVSVLLGNGDGTFSTESTQAAGPFPYSVAVGDFKGDGKLDLAVANYFGIDSTGSWGTVSILLGNGDGTFSIGSTPSMGLVPESVAVGDFNGDGKLDLAVANLCQTMECVDGGNVTILLGDGSGNFTSASSTSPGGTPVAVGDFNGDGKLDFVVAATVLLQVPAPGVTLSPTSLSFGTELVSITSAPQAVTLTNTGSASLNVTGIGASADFAQTNDCGSLVAVGASCTMSVTFTPTALGIRTGTLSITDDAFGSPQVISLAGAGVVSGLNVTLSPTSLTFPDQQPQVTSAPQTVTITNTGTAPLGVTSIAVVGDFAETNTCGASLASGASCTISVTFTPRQTGARTGSLSVNVAGLTPLVVGLTGTGTIPLPFINQPLVPDAVAPGGPSFTLTVNGTGFVSGSVVNWNGSALVTQFINGSQLKATVPAADIATGGTASVTVVNPAPGGGTSNAAFFTVTANTGGTVLFSLTSSLVTDFGPGSSVVVGDFNGDGKLDLAAASYGYVRILLGDGAGNFTLAPSPYVIASGASVAVGDFNGDGKLDLAVATYSGISILLGNGEGTLSTGPTLGGGCPGSSVAVGDFNGDGKLDLAAANESENTVSILLGDGTGNFTLASSPAVGYYPESVAVGDFNGDGKLDLAVANQFSNTVSILLGDGTGNVTLTSSPVVYQPGSVAVGDFNGDERLDLAVTAGGGISILLGDGFGNFTLASSPAVSGGSVAVGDFNGDGKLDLATANGNNTASVLLGDGTGNFTVASSPATGAAYGSTSVAVGDFNGDGRLDLAVANLNGKNENSVSILLQRKPNAEVALSATTRTFSAQLVGTTSAVQTVALSNTGAATLAIASIAATGDYSETNSCGSSVAGGASCLINVTFTPTAPGTRAGKIIIKDNAAGSPQAVQLTGIGSEVSLSPTSLTFPPEKVGTTVSRIVTFANLDFSRVVEITA
jgi:hypothetical protein